MSERYFLALLVIVSSISAVWVSIYPALVQPQLWVAMLLAILGLVSLANINNKGRSVILLPLYFIAALAFLLYVYLSGRQFGIILLSSVLLALVGMIVSFGIPSGTMKKKAKKISVNVVAPEKKASRKRGRRSKKKK
jgi:membrane-bound ClpP family serine protease